MPQQFKVGDFVKFVPPPMQTILPAPWFPGQVVAVAGDVISVACSLDRTMDALCDVTEGWLQVSNPAECQRLIDEHNARAFDDWALSHMDKETPK